MFKRFSASNMARERLKTQTGREALNRKHIHRRIKKTRRTKTWQRLM
nr:MAG TPA: hypothetical protein [Caudoviricetes sp.]DAS79913.1 MAG TPA: hypothetical protein [Caudoviricetes sp.]